MKQAMIWAVEFLEKDNLMDDRFFLLKDAFLYSLQALDPNAMEKAVNAGTF